MSSAKNWQFTLHNPEKWLSWPWPNQVYGVYQLELAPTTGSPHFQGYVAFLQPKRFKALQKLIPGAHLQVARGTPLDNYIYCSKEDSRSPGTDSGPHVFGNIEDVDIQGSRGDLTSAFQYIKEARALGSFSELDFAVEHTTVWAKYPHFVQRCLGLNPNTRGGRTGGSLGYRIPATAPKADEESLQSCIDGVGPGLRQPGGVGDAECRFPEIFVELHYGQSRTGKSTGVRRAYPDAYWKSPGKWWDGLTDETTIVFDDFDGSWFTCSELLRILNPFTYRVEAKGSSFNLQALHFVITSNIHPSDWYREHFERYPEHRYAVQARINLVVSYVRGLAPWALEGPDFFQPNAPQVVAHINDHMTMMTTTISATSRSEEEDTIQTYIPEDIMLPNIDAPTDLPLDISDIIDSPMDTIEFGQYTEY